MKTSCDNITSVDIMLVLHDYPDVIDDVVAMLKTLVYFRTCSVRLHIFQNIAGLSTLSKLLETWNLLRVEFTIYPTQHKISESTADFTRLFSLLPIHLEKVVYVNVQTRLLRDIKEVLHNTVDNNHGVMWAVPAHKENLWRKHLVIIDLKKMKHLKTTLQVNLDGSVIRATCTNPDSTVNSTTSSCETLGVTFISLSSRWGCQLVGRRVDSSCVNPVVIEWPRGMSKKHMRSLPLDVADSDSTIQQMELYRLRKINDSCMTKAAASSEEETQTEVCADLRQVSRQKFITHLYYYNNINTTSYRQKDVTLATMFSFERFDNFLTFVRWWEGPIQATLYCEEKEASTLRKLIAGSQNLIRKNMAIHVVYAQGDFFPINYLRNVAITQVDTAYTLFIDVDLVPCPQLYTILLKQMLHTPPYETLVVPSFEARTVIDSFPLNKVELLQLLNKGSAIGFKMWRKWNYGHSATNFPKWIKANESYTVKYSGAFEPYLVLPTRYLPMYPEVLLERMGDKIVYTRNVVKLGFKFRVLHEAFVLHLQHPKSNVFKKPGHYERCGGILAKETSSFIKNNTKPLDFTNLKI